MQTQPKVVRYRNMISIRGPEYTVTIFKVTTGKEVLYGVKPQICMFMRERNEFAYRDLFGSVAWLKPHDVNALIAYLFELVDPPGLQVVLQKLKEILRK